MRSDVAAAGRRSKNRDARKKEIEEEEKRDFPRTYAQFQKIAGTFL
jgi:hypothetical protein